jgi:hypothetical protein
MDRSLTSSKARTALRHRIVENANARSDTGICAGIVHANRSMADGNAGDTGAAGRAGQLITLAIVDL